MHTHLRSHYRIHRIPKYHARNCRSLHSLHSSCKLRPPSNCFRPCLHHDLGKVSFHMKIHKLQGRFRTPYKAQSLEYKLLDQDIDRQHHTLLDTSLDNLLDPWWFAGFRWYQVLRLSQLNGTHYQEARTDHSKSPMSTKDSGHQPSQTTLWNTRHIDHMYTHCKEQQHLDFAKDM